MPTIKTLQIRARPQLNLLMPAYYLVDNFPPMAPGASLKLLTPALANPQLVGKGFILIYLPHIRPCMQYIHAYNTACI